MPGPLRLLLSMALLLGSVGTALGQDSADGIAAFERGDHVEAVAIWQPLAEAGDPEAQLNIAGMYYHGHGVARDLVLAHMWCDIAASLLPEGDNRLTALRLRAHVALQMSDEERAEAVARAAEWRPAAPAVD